MPLNNFTLQLMSSRPPLFLPVTSDKIKSHLTFFIYTFIFVLIHLAAFIQSDLKNKEHCKQFVMESTLLWYSLCIMIHFSLNIQFQSQILEQDFVPVRFTASKQCLDLLWSQLVRIKKKKKVFCHECIEVSLFGDEQQ